MLCVLHLNCKQELQLKKYINTKKEKEKMNIDDRLVDVDLEGEYFVDLFDNQLYFFLPDLNCDED